ncbi:MAG: BREX-1 system adenine-specific DNA-methyltransferase PglX [Candidatus Sericytochromatia bacterium]|nr:BREX-1 system adenine-specific DNA-methyltransferase PglX [Candidatus Sericytochromatia bacterium]
MDTSKLRKFAQFARRTLIEQVSTKLKQVLAPDSRERREAREAVEGLESQIKLHTREGLIEKVAYTWFNRFCALRYMDLNRFTTVGVVSPLPGQFQPEILAEAKQGHIDEEILNDQISKKVLALLNGSSPSDNPQGEAYRLLFVGACNAFHRVMPYLFERIASYSELLLPDDLLSGSSILAYTCEAMTPEACENVEVIGWLYQYYITEKKDEVFENLKKGKKINPDSIPAATQLFTPHWIVRYLVENSLGRLWLLNRPQSKLAKQMDYYIPPEVPETEFLHIQKPEDLKVCDPACGSGHMLTYAFDLLYAIYEEEGYEANEIPEKILTHNLYGIEIDERAAELAALVLTLKAREKYRRFFRKSIQPQICVLKNVTVDPAEVPAALLEGISRESLAHDARLFAQADHFGSLLVPHLKPSEIQTLQARVSTKLAHPDLKWTENTVLEPLQQILAQADYLSAKYPVVIANPPYMGGKGMNGELKAFAQTNYPDSKSDFFAMFIERGFDLCLPKGNIGMITMQSWMFLSSYEKLRMKLLEQTTIISMAHLGARAFDSIGGEVVSTTAFVLLNHHLENYQGAFLRLVTGNSEKEKSQLFMNAIAEKAK